MLIHSNNYFLLSADDYASFLFLTRCHIFSRNSLIHNFFQLNKDLKLEAKFRGNNETFISRSKKKFCSKWNYCLDVWMNASNVRWTTQYEHWNYTSMNSWREKWNFSKKFDDISRVLWVEIIFLFKRIIVTMKMRWRMRQM